MEKFNGVKREGHGFYGVFINGERVTFAHNPKAAQEKFAKEEARAAMNAQRAASVAAWKAGQVSKSQAQLEAICPDFYTL
jgi:hypothetical protein